MVNVIVMVTAEILTLKGFIIDGESVSVLDGGYCGGLILEILVVAGEVLGLIREVENLNLGGSYWQRDG